MQERYQLILEQTEDIIVEWDIRKERLTVSDNWEKKFGYQPVQDGLMKQISMGSHIHPDDLAECAALQRDMAGGKPYGEKELRVADKDGRYRWCRVRAAAQMDEMGHPLRVVAVIDLPDFTIRPPESCGRGSCWTSRAVEGRLRYT